MTRFLVSFLTITIVTACGGVGGVTREESESGNTDVSVSIPTTFGDATEPQTAGQEETAEGSADVGAAVANLTTIYSTLSSSGRDQLQLCPLGAVAGLLATISEAIAGSSTGLNSFEHQMTDQGGGGVRCVGRGPYQQDESPSVIVSVSAYLDSQQVTWDNPDEIPVLQVGSPRSTDHGDISSICPREQQSEGEAPEHCEAFWRADSADLVLVLGFSGPNVSADAVSMQLAILLPSLLETLSSADVASL